MGFCKTLDLWVYVCIDYIMSNRRMFSNRIANSAKFLQMPAESQLLYFHLVLRADDDGVVECYPVLRLLGLAPDNFKVLQAKGFIRELNEDQVVVITDWLEHNTIRADRKVDSIYKPLLKNLYPDLKFIEAKPRSDVIDNSRRINKNTDEVLGGPSTVSISKVKLSKDNINTYTWKSEYAEKYIQAFNKLFGTKYVLTDGRVKKLKLRFKNFTSEQITKALLNLSRSKFHRGDNDRGWKADPDFLIRSDEMVDKWVNRRAGDSDEI